MMPRQGDVVLIPIPFTDLSSQKRRPVIVVSSDVYNRSTADMIVVAMTSSLAVATYSFPIDNPDLDTGHLNRPGVVRVDKIYTMSQSLVVRTFGHVRANVLERIRATLQQLMASGT